MMQTIKKLIDDGVELQIWMWTDHARAFFSYFVANQSENHRRVKAPSGANKVQGN